MYPQGHLDEVDIGVFWADAEDTMKAE